MPFDKSFQRGQGVGSPPPALGSDPDPTTLTGPAAAAYALRDNCFTFNLQQAGPQSLQLAIELAYQGVGVPGLATVALYLWDPAQTQRWLALPLPSPTLNVGEVIVADVPVVESLLQTQWTIAIVLSVAAPATGIYICGAGLTESAGTANGGPLPVGAATAANQLLQLVQETTIAGELAPTAGTASQALQSQAVLKATPGTLFALNVQVDATALGGTYYLHVVATSGGAVPVDGAVHHFLAPQQVVHTNGLPDRIGYASSVGQSFPDPTGPAGEGICTYLSSTQFTKTVVAAAYLSLTPGLK